jgi:hypothetical protein
MNCLTNRWLKDCVDLTIVDSSFNRNIPSLVIDDSLVRFALNLINHFL